MTTSCDGVLNRLDDLLDGLLDEATRAELIAHVDGCTECRDELEAARSIRAAARALPRGMPPSRDLWAGIAARIEAASDETAVVDISSRRAARVAWHRWAPLAAAAVLLVVASSAITVAMLGSGPGSAPVAAGGGTAGTTPANGAGNAALVAFRPAEAEYQATVQSLEAELEARRGTLEPETVRVIEANLQIIDRAIAEARAALAADPSSADLPLHLSDVYRQKVELLSSAVEIQT